MTNNIFLINYKVELLIIKLLSFGQQHFNNHGRRIGLVQCPQSVLTTQYLMLSIAAAATGRVYRTL